jgi:hypothetical protein
MSIRSVVLAFAVAGLLAGCGIFGGSGDKVTRRAEDPYHDDPNAGYNQNAQKDDSGFAMVASLFGFGGDKKSDSGNAGGGGAPGVGVNSYLWRATLDTIAFMPLASADPFGGVIISDWYSPAEAPNERFKVNIFILGRELRADGVRCTVFRQKRDPGGQWADAPVDQHTGTDLENSILTRARQMRLSTTVSK